MNASPIYRLHLFLYLVCRVTFTPNDPAHDNRYNRSVAVQPVSLVNQFSLNLAYMLVVRPLIQTIDIQIHVEFAELQKVYLSAHVYMHFYHVHPEKETINYTYLPPRTIASRDGYHIYISMHALFQTLTSGAHVVH